jgi:hypothetical protein
MLFTFIKKNGNVQRIGAEDATALDLKLKGYLNEGFDHAEAEEHDQQVIGAVNKQLETALDRIKELEASPEGVPTVEEAAAAGNADPVDPTPTTDAAV